MSTREAQPFPNPDSPPSTYEVVMAHVKLDDSPLAQALQHLPPEQGAAVLLRHTFDMEYEEIAQVLKVPLEEIQAHTQAGLASLREQQAYH